VHVRRGLHWQEVVTVTGDAARVDACVPGPARFAARRGERHSEIAVADRLARAERREIIEVDERS
jgi:myo-inositol 2-dehydrogenase / D-chiro-inositol 1-dehydrogenase